MPVEALQDPQRRLEPPDGDLELGPGVRGRPAALPPPVHDGGLDAEGDGSAEVVGLDVGLESHAETQLPPPRAAVELEPEPGHAAEPFALGPYLGTGADEELEAGRGTQRAAVAGQDVEVGQVGERGMGLFVSGPGRTGTRGYGDGQDERGKQDP